MGLSTVLLVEVTTADTRKNNMRTFLVLCLVGAAMSFPEKLGRRVGRRRQSRQGGAYIAPAEEPLPSYEVVAEASDIVSTKVAAPEPIGFRSSFTGSVASPSFKSSYETDNDIAQEFEGNLKTVGDTEVMVMRGSYSYVGADGVLYEVDWYADETGFHPSAPHLPKSVEPNHPEVAAAVRAQLEFAEQEDLAAAASGRSESYIAPLPAYN